MAGTSLKTSLAFLSTPSARRATERRNARGNPTVFLSTPSARRATNLMRELTQTYKDFYPRPPRGGRPMAGTSLKTSLAFLSTPSARRATSLSPAGQRR